MENYSNYNKLNIKRRRQLIISAFSSLVVACFFFLLSVNGIKSNDVVLGKIQDEFKNAVFSLDKFRANTKNYLINSSNKIDFNEKQLFEKIKDLSDFYFISVYKKSGELFAWNKSFRKLNGAANVTEMELRKPYFEEDNLFELISVIDTITLKKKYFIKFSFLFKKNFSLHNKYEIRNDFSELIKQKFNATFITANAISEGKYSLRLSDKTIGEIQLSEEQSPNTTFCFFSIFFVFVSFLFLFLYLRHIKKEKRKFFFFFLFPIIFRLLLRYLWGDFEQCAWAVSNPELFSSEFGFGLFSSLFSLFFSTVLFSVSLFYFLSFVKNFGYGKILLLISILIFPLLLRAYGATVRSLIFDSTINLFERNFDLSNIINLFFLANIFLISIVFVYLFYQLLSFIFNASSTKKKKYFYVSLLLIYSVAFHFIENFPQASLIFKLLLTLAVYLFLVSNSQNRRGQFILLSGISIFSVVFLLNYHYKDFERDLFKLAASKIATPNKLYFKHLAFTESNKILSELKNGNYIYFNNSLAYKFWNYSRLPYESFSSSVVIGNSGNKKIFFYYNQKENQKVKENLFTAESKASSSEFDVSVNVNYSPEKLFDNSLPEFFIADNQIAAALSRKLNLAILVFVNEKLKFSSQKITLPKEKRFKLVELAKKNEANVLRISLNGTEFLIIPKKTGNRIYVLLKPIEKIATRIYVLIKLLSVLFAFVFLPFVIINLRKLFTIGFNPNYRTAIFSGLIIVSIVPLVLLAFYFRTLSEEKNSNSKIFKLNRKAYEVGKFLQKRVKENNDIILSAVEANKELKFDFSIFHDNKILYTTHPLYYENGIMPDILNPEAILNIQKEKLNGFLLNEKIGKFERGVYYQKINIKNDEYLIQIDEAFNPILLPLPVGELDEMLLTSYSVTAIIILIFGFLLAYYLSKPINELTIATKEIAGGNWDLRIRTKSFGEIKELVNAFNRMSEELKITHKRLLESERENAWREMARQVAHEIKNPLTPMKLSLQQLIAMKKENDENFGSAFDKITASVLSQIDLLKNIASEFSSLGKMPGVKSEKISLLELLTKIKSLYSGKGIEIILDNSLNKREVISDKEYLTRIFVNLISNAKEAKATKVKFSAEKQNGKISVAVENNGEKIPEEIIPKIFEKNFSTKKKGSGLGLFIASRFLEETNGKILLEKSDENLTLFKIIFGE